MIRYSTQCIDDDDIEAVVKALKSDFLTQGPHVDEFENNIAKYTGSKFAVSVSNATCGLHLACLALNVGPDSIVWTSANSFAASANCALYCGAKVDFVDIDSETSNISISKLEEKLIQAEKSKKLPHVLIPVHFAGQSCDMEKIHLLSKKYNFRIIEDASHALGAEYLGKKVGSCQFSDIAVFSFHPVKMITTGEGGMVLTNDEQLFSSVVALRSHGIIKNPDKIKENGLWFYEQQMLGFNFRLTEIQAALGISQLKKIDKFVERRRNIAAVYDKKLEKLNIQLPKEISTSKMSYHLYVVRLKDQKQIKNKIKLFEQLLAKKIGVQVHYIPIYWHPYYQGMGFKKGYCPESEHYYEQALSIPNHPKLTEADQNYVIEVLSELLC